MQQISYNSVEDITDDIRKQIGWRIQEKRIEKGITAVDLSTYLNITANQVSRIERGCAGIDIYKLIVICKILGVSADYILFGEMKEENITISKEQFEAINGLISMFGKEKLCYEYITLSDLVKKVSQDAVEKGKEIFNTKKIREKYLNIFEIIEKKFSQQKKVIGNIEKFA